VIEMDKGQTVETDDQLRSQIGTSAGLIASVVIFLAWSASLCIVGLLVAANGCDDSCLRAGQSDEWSYFSDAWQWTAMRILAVGVLFASVAWAVLVALNRSKAATLVFGVHLLATFALAGLIWSAGTWDAPGNPLLFAAAEATGALPLLMKRHRDRRRPRT
jgi:hypothetical protein